jgi:purine-binding chemotaxis protein CheW
MSDSMLGVINLRGRVIPVVDLRLKFRMPAEAHTSETCIVVVDVANTQIGVMVDRVSEVLDIAAQDIEDAPPLGDGEVQSSIIGMAKSKGRVKILLAIDRVLAGATVEISTP